MVEKAEKDRLLEELMIAYGDELLRLAFTYVSEKELAKVLVQNTFLKCYENLGSLSVRSANKDVNGALLLPPC